MSGKDCVFVLILETSDKSMCSCFLTLFSKTAKKRKKERKQPAKQSNPFFCLQTFLPDEGREGRRNLCMCCSPGYWCCCQVVPHLWMLTSLNAVVCPLRADSCHKTSSFGGCYPHTRSSWMENVEWQVLGYSQPALLNSSRYRGKHSA